MKYSILDAVEISRKIGRVLETSSDLLKPEYREKNKTNPMYGHCYVATEALYYLLNKPTNLKPHRARDSAGVVHWWLEDKKNNFICDVTGDQYYKVGLKPPYLEGKGSGFLTNYPSKRAKILISRIGELNGYFNNDN